MHKYSKITSMNNSAIFDKKGYLIFIILLAFFVGITLLCINPAFLLLFFCFIILVIMCIKFPRTTMIYLGIFLIFQDWIVFQFGKYTFLGLILDRTDEIVILLLISLLLLRNFIHQKKWKKSVIDLPLAFLISIAALSSIINRNVPYMVAMFDLFLLLKGFMVFYIFYNLGLKPEDIKEIIRIFFTIAIIVIVLLGFIDLLFPVYFRSFLNNNPFIDYRFGIPSVQSVFTHPSIFGWFAAFFATFCFSFFIILKKKRNLFFTVVFVLMMILSMRLKPILGTFFAMLASCFLLSIRKKMITIGVSLLLFILLASFLGNVIGGLFEDKIHSYFLTPYRDTQARNVLYSTSLLIMRDYFPLGSGLGTFGGWIAGICYSPLYGEYGISSIYGLEKGGSFLTDTFWPYLIAQFGLIGVICYIWIIVYFFVKGVTIFKKADDYLLKAFILGTIMVLTEALVETIADPVFLRPPQYFFIFASLGIVFSLPKQNKLKEYENSPN